MAPSPGTALGFSFNEAPGPADQKAMRRILAVIVVAWACQGCFVFDEIDKGMEIMEQHSPKRGAASTPSEPKPGSRASKEKQDLGLLARLQKGWEDWNKPKPVQRDPSDVVVRCEIAGAMHFTRKSDCRIRGGTAI